MNWPGPYPFRESCRPCWRFKEGGIVGGSGAQVLILLLVGLAPLSAGAQGLSGRGSFLHQVELGSGRPSIIVLHGGPGFSHQYLRPEWDVLARRHRVMYYDQRGCGRSERRGPYRWEQHVADLHALVLRYKQQGPVVLAGSSWGSVLALLYAWSHPQQVAAMILSGTPPWPIGRSRAVGIPPRPPPTPAGESLPPEIVERRKALEQAQLAYQDALATWMRARQDSVEAGLLQQPTWDSATSLRNASNLRRGLAARLGEHCLGVRAGIYASFERGPHLGDLASIDVPTLLVRGTRSSSQSDGTEQLARVLRRMILVTLMGAGHDPWYERPGQFFAHVERFLRHTHELM
jgi:proline iminopeptidase